ncbi:MAG: hypothetical protein HUJ26_10260 [Planctomycetaceae bacterium]|nr:hypothetical protein [Planctomycetaceae bacterium]
MKIIHEMRLKGPWEYCWKSPDLSAEQLGCPLEGRLKVPVTWSECFGDRAGVVIWSRRFQEPTNLDTTERVMIAAPQLAGVVQVRLNHTPLPHDEQPETGFRFDVTELLAPSNVLEIEMECTSESQSQSRGMTEAAVIEIWSLVG